MLGGVRLSSHKIGKTLAAGSAELEDVGRIHSPKLTTLPLRMGQNPPEGKANVFQASIFRCWVSFPLSHSPKLATFPLSLSFRSSFGIFGHPTINVG